MKSSIYRISRYAVCLALCAVISFLFPVSVFAADCQHQYTSVHVPANCSFKAHTVYTCSVCGDTYSVDDDQFTPPDGIWLSLTGDSANSTSLTVALTLGNSTGIYGFHVKLYYNAAALTPAVLSNGTVWDDSEVFTFSAASGGYINYYSENTDSCDNLENGQVFTVTFDITDPDADYGIYLSHSRLDIIYYDYLPGSEPLDIAEYNLVGAGELGGHSYECTVTPPTCTLDGYSVYTCGVCGDSYTSEQVPAVGHSWILSSVTAEPDFENSGEELYVCTVCKENKTETVPPLTHWKKGDVYHDGVLSPKDGNMLQQILVGTVESSGLQQSDAADVFPDGVLNGKDGNYLTRIINGMVSPD